MSEIASSTSVQGRLAVYAAAQAMGTPLVDVHYDRTIGKRIEALALDLPDELLVLLPARTDTRWFSRMPARHVCLLHEHLAVGGQSRRAPSSSAVQYIGRHPDRFRAAFAPLGRLYGQAGG